MTILKYISVIISGIGIGYIVFSKEPEVIDNTKRYESKIDSLELIVEAKNRVIQIRDNRISNLDHKFDSMINRENKNHRYYAKEKANIDVVPDSAFVSYLSDLVYNR